MFPEPRQDGHTGGDCMVIPEKSLIHATTAFVVGETHDSGSGPVQETGVACLLESVQQYRLDAKAGFRKLK